MSSTAPRDAAAFEIRDAVGEPGCAVCRLTLRSVARLLKSVAYEQVNDLELRATLRKRGGFCNAHAYQWLGEAHSVLGTALIYKDVLQTALRELGSPGGTDSSRMRLLRGRRGHGSEATACPACRAQAEAEARYLDSLLALLASDSAFCAEFGVSEGLCRPHTLAAIRTGRAGVEYILDRSRQALTEQLADLDEVIRKEDYRFRHEPRTEAERAAPARAVAWAAGAEGLT
jgi:hypothetical protein